MFPNSQGIEGRQNAEVITMKKNSVFKIIYIIKKVRQDQAFVEFKVLEDRHVEKKNSVEDDILKLLKRLKK